MKIILNNGMEFVFELNLISETSRVAQIRVGDDLLFIEWIEGLFVDSLSHPEQLSQLQAVPVERQLVPHPR